MRTVLAVFVLAILFSLPASAQQDYPKAEFFGGYQFTHLSPDINASGWNASLTGNVSSWFGLTADVSGAYKNGGRLHTVMVGPTFSLRKSDKVTPFAHVLLGGAFASGNGGSENAFATAVGGGLDVNVNQHVAIRMIQADWLIFRSHGITDKESARVSAGIVFRF